MFSRKSSRSENQSPSPEKYRRSKGLSLLELIIAFVILETATVFFAQWFMTGLDISRKTRNAETALILGQAKMEELIRTVPQSAPPRVLSEQPGTPVLLDERPGNFDEYAYGQSENLERFMWVAEASRAPNNGKLLNLALHVYVVRKRQRPADASAEGSFYISDDRERFTLVRVLDDGSREILVGKEKLAISSAVALP